MVPAFILQNSFLGEKGSRRRSKHQREKGRDISFEEGMDPKLTEVSQLFERFKAALVRNDFDTCSRLLSQLKILLIEFKSLPPLFEETSNAIQELTLASKYSVSCISLHLSHSDCTVILYMLWLMHTYDSCTHPDSRYTRPVSAHKLLRDSENCVIFSFPVIFAGDDPWDIYEHAVVLSVKMEDQDAFERDFFQLKPYYTDAGGRLPQSPQEYPILGLNLLRLLVQNRIAEFHTELELLSTSALENPCIKHAVELEQSFMEGAYNRVLSARQTVPHETYVYFMDLLARTVSHIKRIHVEHPEWEVKNGSVVFQKAKESAPCKEIPSLQLINQTLSYARELERIV
ncbi:26S proteasome non-ATPase regulatory subunit Rpn12 [Cynara cardunculus var. scolymus]|uniref:26S proteasome non-ATPase regulatory subunit Rpn12 n=1 Tax=Cynara cardunculus var. scolymus TaxID=59895 RepID=A0A124SCY8_CYNCS|nr:26S proteasome non-ATPase regulatory subunit Rpn12 [Cynara cardunculus var. scolymus]